MPAPAGNMYVVPAAGCTDTGAGTTSAIEATAATAGRATVSTRPAVVASRTTALASRERWWTAGTLMMPSGPRTGWLVNCIDQLMTVKHPTPPVTGRAAGTGQLWLGAWMTEDRGRGPHRVYTVVVFVILASLDNVAIGLVPPLYSPISADLGVPEGAVSLVTAASYLLTAVAAVAWAYVGDRANRKALLMAGTLLWAAGTGGAAGVRG